MCFRILFYSQYSSVYSQCANNKLIIMMLLKMGKKESDSFKDNSTDYNIVTYG